MAEGKYNIDYASPYCNYRSALSTRYASKEMQYNFSDQKKFSTWRRLWVNLAKAQKVSNWHVSIISNWYSQPAERTDSKTLNFKSSLQ